MGQSSDLAGTSIHSCTYSRYQQLINRRLLLWIHQITLKICLHWDQVFPETSWTFSFQNHIYQCRKFYKIQSQGSNVLPSLSNLLFHVIARKISVSSLCKRTQWTFDLKFVLSDNVRQSWLECFRINFWTKDLDSSFWVRSKNAQFLLSLQTET